MDHPQVKLWYQPYSEEVEVDEKLAPFLELLWKHGIETMMSCQDTPHPGRDDNSSCGRVWIMFPEPKDALNFVRQCVPHPETTDFAEDCLYNRAYKYFCGSLPAERLNDPDQIVDFKLWEWECHLSDANHGTWFDDGDKFLGPSYPGFEISVRFPFEDIAELTDNLRGKQ